MGRQDILLWRAEGKKTVRVSGGCPKEREMVLGGVKVGDGCSSFFWPQQEVQVENTQSRLY